MITIRFTERDKKKSDDVTKKKENSGSISALTWINIRPRVSIETNIKSTYSDSRKFLRWLRRKNDLYNASIQREKCP